MPSVFARRPLLPNVKFEDCQDLGQEGSHGHILLTSRRASHAALTVADEVII